MMKTLSMKQDLEDSSKIMLAIYVDDTVLP